VVEPQACLAGQRQGQDRRQNQEAEKGAAKH
jgi:hypothetical protein